MTLADRLARVDASRHPRPLAELVDRLSAEGHLRGSRASDGRPIAPTGIGTETVTSITADSRAVRPGALFVAVPGAHADGHDFVAAAAAGRRGRGDRRAADQRRRPRPARR